MNILQEINSNNQTKNRQKLFYVIDFWDVSPHIETSLEIVNNLSEANAKVYYSCFTYSTKMGNMSKITKPDEVEDRLKKIYNQVQFLPNVKIIPSLVALSKYEPIAKCPKYPSSASLIQLNKDKCMIGSSILASLSTGEPLSIYPYLYTHNHLQTIDLMIDSYSHVFEAVKKFLEAEPITDIVVCNGIHLHSNAVYSAANYSERAITTHFHERGQNAKQFLITSSDPPHSMSKFLKDLKSYLVDICKGNKLNIRRSASEEYFRRTIINSKHSATNLLSTKELHNCLLNRKRTNRQYQITLFTSSDAENITSGPTCTLPGGWNSQVEFLVDFILAYNSRNLNNNLNLNVRIHPNISQYHPDDLQRQICLFENLEGCNLYLPEDECDSYELASKSDIVISYGSTISLETAYMGIPSYVAAPTPYELCGLVPRIYHLKQLKNIFETPHKTINSYKHVPRYMFNTYCQFLEEREIKHRYYVSTGFSTGLFKNQSL